MSIPKQHTLRHSIHLLGQLYGENPAVLKEYMDERVAANLGDLDGAIDCFRGLLPEGHERKIEDENQTALKAGRLEEAKK